MAMVSLDTLPCLSELSQPRKNVCLALTQSLRVSPAPVDKHKLQQLKLCVDTRGTPVTLTHPCSLMLKLAEAVAR